MTEINLGDIWRSKHSGVCVTVISADEERVHYAHPDFPNTMSAPEKYFRYRYALEERKEEQEEMTDIKVGDSWKSKDDSVVVKVVKMEDGRVYYDHPYYSETVWESEDYFRQKYMFKESEKNQAVNVGDKWYGGMYKDFVVVTSVKDGRIGYVVPSRDNEWMNARESYFRENYTFAEAKEEEQETSLFYIRMHGVYIHPQWDGKVIDVRGEMKENMGYATLIEAKSAVKRLYSAFQKHTCIEKVTTAVVTKADVVWFYDGDESNG